MKRVVGDQLEDEHYTVKTRGERYQPGARAIGQGSYEFVRHEDHVHFTCRLDDIEHDAPDELHVDELGDYLVLFDRTQVPSHPPTRAIWTAAGDPSLLDSEGAELVIVGHGECNSET